MNVVRGFYASILAALLCCWTATTVQAQNNNNNNGFNQAVGGVLVDTTGVLKNMDAQARQELVNLRKKVMQEIPGDLQAKTELRMISLRQLQATIAKHQADNQPLPDDVLCLAGLQRVQYVFVDEANQDIVIAGPAEGWKVAADGTLVGAQSGRPVMMLDDLMVALRTIQQAAKGGISCSIDPTQEGIQKVQQYVSTLRAGFDHRVVAAEQEKLLGMQNITLTGVPQDSHFAQVLVAADYRMKRIGMKHDASPVKAVVSYLDMVTARESIYPRWWLSPSYEPIGKATDGSAYELRGVGVKCLSAEDQFVDGKRVVKQATNSAQRWAESFSKHYSEIAAAEPIFAELQNCMDLAVVAALITNERLADKANLQLDVLLNEKSLPHARFAVPKQVPSIASFIKKGSNYIITASGGVQFQPWEAVQKPISSETAATAKTKVLATRGKNWYWN
jgi:hypothetical protein